MSKLQLSNTNWGSRNLNVIAFSSPVTGMIPSAQTRKLVHHFPIKALQPELEIEVIFRNEREYEDFQVWVRNVQIDAQTNLASPGVTINWPQRSIYNWTGLIRGIQAGGQRRNYTPRAKFAIDLVDSMVSSRTTLSSIGSAFEEIFGINTPGGILGSAIQVTESLLQTPQPVQEVTPSAPSGNQQLQIVSPIPSTTGGGGSGGGGGGGGSF